MMGGKLRQATITTPPDPMRGSHGTEYLIDGEKFTWRQIIDRAKFDLRGRALKVTTITTRLRRGVSTWARLREPTDTGRERSKKRFAGWVVNPGKQQAARP